MTEIPIPGRGSAYSTPGARTSGMIAMTIIHLLMAIASIILGVLFLMISYGIEYTLGGSLVIFVGLLFLLVVYGLWNMQSWAWIVTMLSNIFQIVGYIFFMIVFSMPFQLGIVQVIVSSLVVIYFILPTTRSHFSI